MAWVPDKVIRVEIAADKSVDLSLSALEEKLRGWSYHGSTIVCIKDLDTGEVSQASLLMNTTCIVCKKTGARKYSNWSYGSTIASTAGPYCPECWAERKDFHQPPDKEELQRRAEEEILIASTRSL